MSVLVEKI